MQLHHPGRVHVVRRLDERALRGRLREERQLQAHRAADSTGRVTGGDWRCLANQNALNTEGITDPGGNTAVRLATETCADAASPAGSAGSGAPPASF